MAATAQQPEAYVWAVDHARAPDYWFPRQSPECPGATRRRPGPRGGPGAMPRREPGAPRCRRPGRLPAASFGSAGVRAPSAACVFRSRSLRASMRRPELQG
ncbi:DUF6886 family protein [Dactylosporangium roseum]|uniref:DUF6886 family protein n=1 Tax=Dactylosporangium roseum TaxID=47989 RepID=UPI0036F262E1